MKFSPGRAVLRERSKSLPQRLSPSSSLSSATSAKTEGPPLTPAFPSSLNHQSTTSAPFSKTKPASPISASSTAAKTRSNCSPSALPAPVPFRRKGLLQGKILQPGGFVNVPIRFETGDRSGVIESDSDFRLQSLTHPGSNYLVHATVVPPFEVTPATLVLTDHSKEQRFRLRTAQDSSIRSIAALDTEGKEKGIHFKSQDAGAASASKPTPSKTL